MDAKQHRLDKAKQMSGQKIQVSLSGDSSLAILDGMHTGDLMHEHVCTAFALPPEMLYTINLCSFLNREARHREKLVQACPIKE